MRSAWDATDDISFLIKQIRVGAVFAYFVGQQKTDKELVTLGEKAILDTGLFATQYQGWKCRPDNARTWSDFEEYWQAEYDLWHETSNTAAQVGYGGNINHEPDTQETDQAYFSSLQHFGETNSHNAATFSTLSATDAQMANSIHLQIADLTRKLEGLVNAIQAPPPHQHNTAYPPTPVSQPPVYNQPPFAQMQQQQYTQAPPTHQYHSNRGFGRTGGHGRNNRPCRHGAHQQGNNPIQQIPSNI